MTFINPVIKSCSFTMFSSPLPDYLHDFTVYFPISNGYN